MITIYMMVGIPASGKTTIAKKLAAEDSTIAYVSRDEIRFGLFGSYEVQIGRERLVRMKFCSKIAEYIKAGYKTIIADATHATSESRMSFYKTMNIIALQENISPKSFNIIPFVIETPYEICYARNEARPKEIAVPNKEMTTYYAKAKYPAKTHLGTETAFPIRIFYNSETGETKVYKFIEDN